MQRWRRPAIAGTAVAVAAAMSLGVSLPAGARSNPGARLHRAAAGRATPTTATWAEAFASPPNWILPFTPLQFYSYANIGQFQQLLYRPLYWTGNAQGEPVVDEHLSLAQPPRYSNEDTVVTIDLEPYRWANGTMVDARDVVFFVNLAKAEPVELAGYFPGEFPDNVVSVSAPSMTGGIVTLTLNHSYNPTWFTANELSLITPLPIAWDISKLDANGQPAPPGTGGCSRTTSSSSVAAACGRVWKFLSGATESGDLATYATNPLWKVVDGPWRLSAFTRTGMATFVPNPTYSGPVRPSLERFVEVPFTSPAAEFSALENGSISVGYVPVSDVPPAPAPGVTGPNNPNLAASYNLEPADLWSIDYAPMNFNSNGDGGAAGAIIRQLYFRQAFQELVDQPALIAADNVSRNYGVPTYGPIPVEPKNPYTDAFERSNPLPYDAAAAVASLKAHGWKVVPGGTDVCVSASSCGKGIRVGTELKLQLVYAAGDPELTNLVRDEAAGWAQAGIHVMLKGEPFNSVLSAAVPCTGGPQCAWEIADWGGGWLFQPDLYPSGEMLFAAGAGANSGSYSDRTADKLIGSTLRSSAAGTIERYEDYLAVQVPVLWQPISPGADDNLFEVAKQLHGVFPMSPIQAITPETWRFAPSR